MDAYFKISTGEFSPIIYNATESKKGTNFY